MSKTNPTQSSSTVRASKQSELDALEIAFISKFGFAPMQHEILRLAEKHESWHVKRYQGHRWEVRTGIKDKTYYGTTLAEALCRALLEI